MFLRQGLLIQSASNTAPFQSSSLWQGCLEYNRDLYKRNLNLDIPQKQTQKRQAFYSLTPINTSPTLDLTEPGD